MGISSGGETRNAPSSWTTDTLKAYVERIMDESDKRYEQRHSDQKEAVKAALASSERAVEKAEAISEKWRQNANEWRAAMSDKDKLYLTKDVAKSYFIAGIMAAGVMIALVELFVRMAFGK